MTDPKRGALLSWSGGKDSALCLYELAKKKEFMIKGLLTTLTKDYERISMHGVRRNLLLAQSESIGIPIREVWIPSKASNEEYQAEMASVLARTMAQDEIKSVIFGDLFLGDIREFREKFLVGLGFECVFPLWGMDTFRLARDFIDSGFKAIICTVDPKKLDPKFCGKEFDNGFLSKIPESVDPCGENGEFHTFVYGGPIFKKELGVRVGEIINRNGFYFADILSI